MAVQLRATTNGETSGAVADCLTHGVATVVTDIGPAHLLPDFVDKVPVDATPEVLAETLRRLLDDPEHRGRPTPATAWPSWRTGDSSAEPADLLAAVLPVPAWAPGPGPAVSRSMVVVSLEAGAWLEECLASVRDQTDQLIVVDNGSPGSRVSGVGRRFGATVVRNRTNQGFTGGVNQGIRCATGDVVALLNDDAVAGPTWLAGAEAALSVPSVAAVTPKVLLQGWFGQVLLADEAWYAPSDARPLGRQLTSLCYGGEELLDRLVGPGVHRLESGLDRGQPAQWRWTRPGKPFYVPLTSSTPTGPITVNGNEELTCSVVCRLINNTGLFLRSDGYAGDHGLESPDDGRWDHQRETFGVSGTAMVTRAETLKRVGLLADPFFAYYEDADWSWRARRLGYELMYVAVGIGFPPAVGDLGPDPRHPGSGVGRAEPAAVHGAQRSVARDRGRGQAFGRRRSGPRGPPRPAPTASVGVGHAGTTGPTICPEEDGRVGPLGWRRHHMGRPSLYGWGRLQWLIVSGIPRERRRTPPCRRRSSTTRWPPWWRTAGPAAPTGPVWRTVSMPTVGPWWRYAAGPGGGRHLRPRRGGWSGVRRRLLDRRRPGRGHRRRSGSGRSGSSSSCSATAQRWPAAPSSSAASSPSVWSVGATGWTW